MFHLSLFVLFSTLGVPAPIGVVVSADENPMYTSWASYPVGTTVKTRTSTTIKGQTLPGGDIKKIRLVSKTEERVVLEEVLTTVLDGETIENDPERIVYKRALPPGIKPGALKSGRSSEEEGEEEIEVLGKTYATRWTETKAQTEAGPSFTRTWTSVKMPGQIVRSVTRIPSIQKVVTIEVEELTIPGEEG